MFRVPKEVLLECSKKSRMQCKPSLFPILDFETTTEDGPFDLLFDSEKFVSICRPGQFMCVLFYQRAFSNFDGCPVPMKIGEFTVEPKCGEAAFKMACAAAFNDWEVFKKALYAETPKDCKKTSRAISSFVPAVWDAKAYEVCLSSFVYCISCSTVGIISFDFGFSGTLRHETPFHRP